MPSKIIYFFAIAMATCIFSASLTGCGTNDEEPLTSSQIGLTPSTATNIATIEGQGQEDGPMTISSTDRENIFDSYRLPALERMDEEDADEFVNCLQSIKRVKTVGYDTSRVAYPDYWYKCTYNEIDATVSYEYPSGERDFTASTASELNAFMETAEGGVVAIRTSEIVVDEPIQIPSNTKLVGNGCRLIADGATKAISIQGTEHSTVEGFIIDGGFGYGIYIEDASGFTLRDSSISGASVRAVAVLRECHDFRIAGNDVSFNSLGGIFCSGNVHDGIIEENTISHNEGVRNYTAGLFLGNYELADHETAQPKFLDPDLDTVETGPHNIVVVGNALSHNRSQGLYSHMGFSNFFVSNTINGNHKEGACLDWGTLGTYVYGNSFTANGFREGVNDGEPASSKLPGISLDNACYNVLKANTFSDQGGSGVKAVRSSCRNLIVDNAVVGNNEGASNEAHFFGIELASDLSKDYPDAKGMDFSPCYENIVTRNTVSGRHYSGIFLGADDYCNDVFNNVVMGATDYSIESHSEKFNSIVDNVIDMPEFYNGNIISISQTR